MKHILKPGIIATAILMLFALQNAVAQDMEAVLKAKPLTWTGSIGANMTSYFATGTEQRMNPFHYGVFGNFNFRLMEEFDLPVSFNYNQFGLDIQKPFYQLGISPKYKKFQLHLGHRNMFFNSYSLAGHTFLGVGLEFNPGKFRFAAMKGRLREPVFLDATQTQSFTNPQFSRSGWGIKLGVGTVRNHFDIMLFSARDDAGSIENWEDLDYQNSISGQTGRFSPQENLILGITSRWTLFKGVTWSIEAGASLFTDDLTRDIISGENPVFTPKTTTVLKWAGKTNLNIPLGPLHLNAGYERIMPDYFSMGMYHFINDMENITISPGLNLFSGKLFLNGMVGIQRNNLEGTRSETTRRVISSANATIAPKPEYGININYTNFSFNQQPQLIQLSDTFLIKQINTSLSITPYYNISRDTIAQQSVNAALIFQNAEDLNPVTREFGNLNTRMITANYSATNAKGYQIGGGLNYTQISNALFTNVLQGINLQAGRNLMDKGVNISINSQLNATRVDGEPDGMLVSSGITGSVFLLQRHNFHINLNWLYSSSKKFDSYNELIFNMGYTLQIK